MSEDAQKNLPSADSFPRRSQALRKKRLPAPELSYLRYLLAERNHHFALQWFKARAFSVFILGYGGGTAADFNRIPFFLRWILRIKIHFV
jgi:hypothetical protein